MSAGQQEPAISSPPSDRQSADSISRQWGQPERVLSSGYKWTGVWDHIQQPMPDSSLNRGRWWWMTEKTNWGLDPLTKNLLGGGINRMYCCSKNWIFGNSFSRKLFVQLSAATILNIKCHPTNANILEAWVQPRRGNQAKQHLVKFFPLNLQQMCILLSGWRESSGIRSSMGPDTKPVCSFWGGGGGEEQLQSAKQLLYRVTCTHYKNKTVEKWRQASVGITHQCDTQPIDQLHTHTNHTAIIWSLEC